MNAYQGKQQRYLAHSSMLIDEVNQRQVQLTDGLLSWDLTGRYPAFSITGTVDIPEFGTAGIVTDSPLLSYAKDSPPFDGVLIFSGAEASLAGACIFRNRPIRGLSHRRVQRDENHGEILATVPNGANLSTFVANSGLSQALSGAVPDVCGPWNAGGLHREFASHETVAVRTAKTWDSPRAGTVPVLLGDSG